MGFSRTRTIQLWVYTHDYGNTHVLFFQWSFTILLPMVCSASNSSEHQVSRSPNQQFLSPHRPLNPKVLHFGTGRMKTWKGFNQLVLSKWRSNMVYQSSTGLYQFWWFQSFGLQDHSLETTFFYSLKIPAEINSAITTMVKKLRWKKNGIWLGGLGTFSGSIWKHQECISI